MKTKSVLEFCMGIIAFAGICCALTVMINGYSNAQPEAAYAVVALIVYVGLKEQVAQLK